MEFSFNIVEKLFDRYKAQELAEAMVFDYLWDMKICCKLLCYLFVDDLR